MQDLRFKQVGTMEELQRYWPYVKAGIEHIKYRDKSFGHLTSTHVYNGIRFGLPTAQPRTTAVELFLAVTPKDEPRGFMVTTPRQDPFRNNIPIGIYVWFLYADFDMLTRFLPQLERLGKINGGEQIRFESGRFSWLGKLGLLCEKAFEFGRMGKLGFRLHQIVITKDLA